MQIFLIGSGPGRGEYLTAEAADIVRRSKYVLGTQRVLSGVRAYIRSDRITQDCGEKAENTADPAGPEYLLVKTYTEDARKLILEIRRKEMSAPLADISEKEASGCTEQFISVLYSGDSGFFSGAGRLKDLLLEEGLACTILPGISSIQYFAAGLGESWQDWLLLSSHGKYCNIRKEICKGKPVFLLTGSMAGGIKLLEELSEAGLSELSAAAGIELSYPGKERILKGSVSEILSALDKGEERGLLVLLVYPPKHYACKSPGIPDEEFIRGERPMTKREIRALVMSALQAGEEDTVLDIGAGTGGMSIELSMQAGTVIAVEKEEEGIRLLNENRKHFGAWNLCIIKGRAPEILRTELKGIRIDKVFIGGSDGELAEILNAVRGLSANAEICLTAITLETLSEAMAWFEGADYEVRITQVTVTASVKAGRKHMMKGGNPVYILSGQPSAGTGSLPRKMKA